MTLGSKAASNQLKSFVERIERMEEEKKTIADDIKDIYAEAKANGFDTKVLRLVIRRRKQDADEQREQDAILETYLAALGMGPLFDDSVSIDRIDDVTVKVSVPGHPESAEMKLSTLGKIAEAGATETGRKILRGALNAVKETVA